MTQPKYDLDKAMASPAARAIVKRVLEGEYRVYDFSVTGIELRNAARVQSVEEADRAYVDAALEGGIPAYCKPNRMLEKLEACREARAREAAEREGE